MAPPIQPRVIIVGGGFGGLWCARRLAKADVTVTLLDRTNHHLFQPLLYQVAMAGLSPAEIAAPIRSLLRDQANVRVLLAEVQRVDVQSHEVWLDDGTALPFDWLVLAVGAKTSYFGHEDWERYAAGLKTIEDALEIRRRVLMAFERAERTADPVERRQLLTFAVIGGGPTGVELAGSIAELAHTVLSREFRSMDPDSAQVVLIEAGPRILAQFPEALGQCATTQLAELGVQVRTGNRVAAIDQDGVAFGDGQRLASRTVVWGAGVRGTRLAQTLGVPLDKIGRVVVERDCSAPGHPTVFAIGDMAAHLVDGVALPGLCPVAMQQGSFVGDIIARNLPAGQRGAFAYNDRGTMATIGRSRAIAWVGKRQLSGWPAWLAWLLIHLILLIGFRNRFVVLFTWAWSYFAYKRGARLITERNSELQAARPVRSGTTQQLASAHPERSP